MQRVRLTQGWLCIIAVTAMLGSGSSCRRTDSNIPKVAKAVNLFNERFNAAQFHEIYADADPRFQQSVNESQFVAKLNDLRQQHGLIQTSRVNGFENMTRWQRLFPESKPTRFVGFYNHCAIGGFQELFQFDVTGEEAKLLEFQTEIDPSKKP